MLQLDLVGLLKGTPVILDIISCSLSQFTENAKVITKEVFKLYNLKQDGAESIKRVSIGGDALALKFLLAIFTFTALLLPYIFHPKRRWVLHRVGPAAF